MRHAHRAGLRTTATMMYGTVETDEERLEHLLRLRALQDETGGFTAFITWSYQPDHTELAGTEATGIDYLRTLAHRAHRPRQLRQPAGVVGDAGRQGRAAEPRVRRQRHGQRDDRGERRPRRRRQLLHGRSRDRAQHRGRRLRRQAPQHALRDARRSDLPRARGAADARARHRARGRRHAACPRSWRTIRRAAAPASSSVRVIRHIDPLSRLLGPADQRAADSRRLGRRRSRPRSSRSARRGRACRADGAARTSISATSRSCPAWSTRTRTSSCRTCATRCRRRPQFVTWVRGVMRGAARASRSRARREILDARRRRDRGGGRVRHGARRRHQQHARRRSGRSTRSALAAVVFYELIRFNTPDPDGRGRRRRSPTLDALRADRARARQPRGARAVLGGAARAPRHPRRRSTAIRSRRAASTCPSRRRRWSSSAPAADRGARCSRRSASWDPAWVPPGGTPVQFLDDSGFLDARVLAVHGVQMTTADLARLAARGTTLVTCPRSNGHTGAGAPPIEDFYASGVQRGGRHRQPGQRAGPERLRRAGDDARAGADGAGRARCSTARRGRARARSASTPTTARSSRASRGAAARRQRPAGHRRCGRISGGRHRAEPAPLART